MWINHSDLSRLIECLALSKDQAESVLKLQLGSLVRLKKDKLIEEQESLKSSIAQLQRFLNEDANYFTCLDFKVLQHP